MSGHENCDGWLWKNIYTSWPKVCGHISFPKSWALTWSWSPITASTLLGRLSTRCSNISAGSYFHSAIKALVRPGTDVGWLGLAHCCSLVVSVATEDRPFLHAKCFSTLQFCSVSVCGLPLQGWAIAAPRHFHFTITALTVDRGSSNRAEILRTNLLERWHPMTVALWKSLSSTVRPFYCQCLSIEIAWLCARFYTPVSNSCGWNSRVH